MPRCWMQSGKTWIRNWYIDDQPPENVQKANSELEQLLRRLKELGVDIKARRRGSGNKFISIGRLDIRIDQVDQS